MYQFGWAVLGCKQAAGYPKTQFSFNKNSPNLTCYITLQVHKYNNWLVYNSSASFFLRGRMKRKPTSFQAPFFSFSLFPILYKYWRFPSNLVSLYSKKGFRLRTYWKIWKWKENGTKEFDLPRRGFEPQIFEQVPVHDLNFEGD